MERPLAVTAVLINSFAIRSQKARISLKRLLKGTVYVGSGASKITYLTVFYFSHLLKCLLE